MRFLVVCFLSVSVLASSQQQKAPPAAITPDCLEFSLEGRVNGGEEYSHELGGGLRIRLLPSKENWGWMVQVQPLESTDDYAYPVNPPFRSGNSQWLSTGYGETVEQQLKYEHEVYFVLNRAEHEHAMKLADDAMSSSDLEAAGRFLSILPTLRSAVLRIKPTKYETADKGETVEWMQFGVTVTTPANFRPASGLNARRIACPSKEPLLVAVGTVFLTQSSQDLHRYGEPDRERFAARPGIRVSLWSTVLTIWPATH
jgi:hypothetical protein